MGEVSRGGSPCCSDRPSYLCQPAARMRLVRPHGKRYMPLHEIIGFVAGFGTTFAALPDLIAMLKRRSTRGMNPTMAGIMGSFQILWVYYGFLIESRPVIGWNIVAVIINFLMVGAYLYFKRLEQGLQ